MIIGEFDGEKFEIDDFQNLSGGGYVVKQDHRKAKSEFIHVSDGPVAIVLFDRMAEKREGYSLVKRVDPPETVN